MSLFGREYGQKISGQVLINGKEVEMKSVKDAIDNKLAYYFFGYFIFGLIHKLFSIPTQYGFNLSLVTIAAMLATSLTTLIFYFKKHINFSIFAAFSIVILSNFEKFYICGNIDMLPWRRGRVG